jgi:hypothetical protein
LLGWIELVALLVGPECFEAEVEVEVEVDVHVEEEVEDELDEEEQEEECLTTGEHVSGLAAPGELDEDLGS